MDRRIQNNRTAILIRFVKVSGLLIPLSATLTIMRVVTIHATKAETFHLDKFIIIYFYVYEIRVAVIVGCVSLGNRGREF